MKFDVCVIGLGYIGLPTAAVIASNGLKVCGVDINKDVIEKINLGKIHIVEPGLEQLVKDAVKKKIYVPNDVPVATTYVIAVPTPIFDDTKLPDLSFVLDTIRPLAPKLQKGCTVIIESTSPPGTTDEYAKKLQEMRPDLVIASEMSKNSDISVAYCPERVLPGKVILS